MKVIFNLITTGPMMLPPPVHQITLSPTVTAYLLNFQLNPASATNANFKDDHKWDSFVCQGT